MNKITQCKPCSLQNDITRTSRLAFVLVTSFITSGGISLTCLRPQIQCKSRRKYPGQLRENKTRGPDRGSKRPNPIIHGNQSRLCTSNSANWWNHRIRGTRKRNNRRLQCWHFCVDDKSLIRQSNGNNSQRSARLTYWKSRSGFRRVRVTGKTKLADHQKQ